MTVNGKRNNNRGVSESIGFILIFALVITGIGLVTLSGYPMLLQQQSSANERIMEKNMIVLQNDFKSLAYKTVPYKETSLKVEGGTLYIHNTLNAPPVGTFRIYDNSGAPDYVVAYHPGDLEYDAAADMTYISLQNGAVIKKQDSGSVMLAQPRWFYDRATNTWVINLIAVNSSETLARTGICFMRMGLADNTTEYFYTDTLTPPIKIDYTPDPANDYSTAWDSYFQYELKTAPPTIVGSTRTYILPTVVSPAPRLVIKKYEVMMDAI